MIGVTCDRQLWIRERREYLASMFAIDCLTYTVLSNHLHLVLRSRPDVVRKWIDRNVAEHLLRLFPQRRNQDGSLKTPSDAEVRMIASDNKRLAEQRLRLSDINEHNDQKPCLGRENVNDPDFFLR